MIIPCIVRKLIKWTQNYFWVYFFFVTEGKGRELDSSKQNLLKISIYAFICFSYFVVLYRSFVNILKQARVISTKIDIRKYELIGDVFLINVLYYLLSIIVISIKYFSKGVVKKEQIGVHFLNQVSFDTFMLSKENV